MKPKNKTHGCKSSPYACEGCSRYRQKMKRKLTKAKRIGWQTENMLTKKQIKRINMDKQIPPYVSHVY